MARHDRKRYGNIGVYDPPEPSLKVLPEEARQRWQDVYDTAMYRYNRAEIAEATAWRTVRMSYKPGGKGSWIRCANNRCQVWPEPRMVPQPDFKVDGKPGLAGLGVLIEYGYIDPDGVLQIVPSDRDHPPMLYWDDVGKRLYAFPHVDYAGCDLIPNTEDWERAGNVIRRWAKGRDPQCASSIQVPKKRIFAIGVADTVSYRSSKFDGKSELRIIDLRGKPRQDPREPEAQEYIHKHWQDVWTWQDDDADPSIIVIEGGALDVHNKGIIH